jgi:CRP-like cAMP-binding protein
MHGRAPAAGCRVFRNQETYVSSTKPAVAANRLLASLPRKDARRILAGCQPVELVFAEVLAEPGERIRHVYFPTESFISLTTSSNGSVSLEVGLIGDEGMLGVSLILGVDIAPLHALVQGAGPALRMDAALFRRELALSPALKGLLQRYLYVVMGQLAQAAACTRLHLVEARLARWLLMTQDRAHSDEFRVTHEFMAYKLGVRRVGITKAAISLQDRRLIHYSRGDITILDRGGLEAASCGCYEADKATYARVMG